MEKVYRPLTTQEIALLEQRGCQAEDWNRVLVAPQFEVIAVQQVRFFGDIRLGVLDGTIQVDSQLSRPCGIRNAELHEVTVGDHCLIENIGSYLSKVELGDACYLSNVGVVELVGTTTYGQGTRINVLSEVGEETSLVLYRELTAQEAFLIAHYEYGPFIDYEMELPKAEECTVCHLGNGVHIVGAKTLRNVWLGDGTRIEGASLLADVTVDSIPEQPTVVGHDCIIRESILSETSEVLDGAKVERCFVGQAAHLGLGFSATNSVFFANCYMDNGEACSVVAGPFTVSHHKCSLLIACMTSLCNIGSGTNMSNHAYKMGPVHHGFLRQGSKTASNAHLVWPGTIGAFSVVSGKTTKMMDTTPFPFSYIFCENDHVQLVPGVNALTYGTFRDILKWGNRDKRPSSCRRDIVYASDFMTPELMDAIQEGKKVMNQLKEEQPDAPVYFWKGLTIAASALKRGLEIYQLLEEIYWGFFYMTERSMPDPQVKLIDDEHLFDDGWVNALGTLVPQRNLLQMQLGAVTDFKSSLTLPIVFIKRFWELESARFRSYRYTWSVTKYSMDDEKLKEYYKKYYFNMKKYRDCLLDDLDKECTKGSVSTLVVEQEKEKLRGRFQSLLKELKSDLGIKDDK